jgi:putative PEP-CTERM system histidine kinase
MISLVFSKGALHMFTVFLLWLNIVLSPLAAVILLVRRSYFVSTLLLSSALFFLAGLTYIDLQTLQYPDELFHLRKYAIIFEALVVFCGYFHTKTAFRDNSEIYRGSGFWISIVLAFSTLAYVFSVSPEQLIFSPDFAEEHILYLTNTGFGFYLVLMIYLVFGLVQLERTLAGLHQVQRWGIKFPVLSSGLLLASFAFYFSHSLLYRSINMNYLDFRSVAVAVAIVLFFFARNSRESTHKLALSRGIAHRSFVLLIVGGYLILLGVVGEGLRYLNVTNARSIFYGLLLISVVVLAIIFLSEKIRRKIRVIFHKNFYQSKYDYQEQWQKFATQISSGTTLSEIKMSILDMFCEPLACKGGAFYLRDFESGDYLFSESFNFRRDWRPFSAGDPLISQLRECEWIINLKESHPEFSGSLVESLTVDGAFLIIPLFFDEELEGFIVLAEQIDPDEKLSYEDYDLLKMLARQSIATVQGLRLSEQLSTARELAAIGKVSTFVLHDLKNQVSGLSLMLDNAREYINDPDFQEDMLETVGNTVRNMKGLIARLKNVKEKPELVIAAVELGKIVHDAAETAAAAIEVHGDPIRVAVDEEEIYKVILNLLVNAVEATSQGRAVQVSYGKHDRSAFVEVKDFGCGMRSEFMVEKLFKPFETTKKHGFGIGLYQCQQIVESHGGCIEVESQEGVGTTFTLHLPLAS